MHSHDDLKCIAGILSVKYFPVKYPDFFLQVNLVKNVLRKSCTLFVLGFCFNTVELLKHFHYTKSP